jgi:hypothetical protein
VRVWWHGTQVARVYGGHTSKEVMLFEHEVLGLLQRAVATSPRHEDDDGDTSGSGGSACKEQQRRQLSFRVPCLVPTRGGSDVGCTHIDVDVLRAGGCGGSRVPRYAALFEFIEGAHPSFADLLQVRTTPPLAATTHLHTSDAPSPGWLAGWRWGISIVGPAHRGGSLQGAGGG